jgi:hypothetical protein
MQGPTFDHRLEHLFSYRIAWENPPQVIGPTPEGLRVNFHFVGGEIGGPRLRGRIRSVGSERLVVRHDDVGILDLRATFETESGAIIDAPFLGVIDLGDNRYDDLSRGRLAPDGSPFRSATRYQTAHPDYQWLNRLQCVGVGCVFPSRSEARCDVYALC